MERQNNGDSVIWKFQDAQFEIEIITDREIRAIKKIKKSDTIVESEDDILHKFSDLAFEIKMNQLINMEDGFDDADEEEGNKGVKYYRKADAKRNRAKKLSDN